MFLILINVIIFGVLLVALEGVLRFLEIPHKITWTPSENAIARFDPELGWSYIPGITRVLDFPVDRKVPVSFNDRGLRVPSPRTRLSSTRPSVLFVGGSFTMGHGLSYEESFVGQLAKMRPDLQMVNLGVQAYGTDQTYLMLKRHGDSFQPKVIVYTFIEDHIIRNSVHDRRLIMPGAKFLGTKPLFCLDSSGELKLAKEPGLYKDYTSSYLYDYSRMTIGKSLGLFPPFRVDVTKQLIRKMDEYAKERGAKFVVVNFRWFPQYYNEFEDLKAEGIPVLDTLEDPPENWTRMHLHKDPHPGPEASKHVANMLEPVLD